MKVILLIIVITFPLAYLFGSEEYELHTKTAEIVEFPGFAPATFESILKTESKKNSTYRVRFLYEVDGKKYKVTTSPTDQQGALGYVTERDMQVAYSTQNPSVSMLKRYYDLRHTRGTRGESLIVTSIFSLALSIPIALGISWRLGWLRRKKVA